MEWISDPSVGAWLAERLDTAADGVDTTVPSGYPAYLRIFHPGQCASIPGGELPHPKSTWWGRITPDEFAKIVEKPVTWAETAAAFGTVMHPLAQWQGVTRTPDGEDWQDRTCDGRLFRSPDEGSMSPESFTHLAEHLLAHTATPDDTYTGIWEGHGGLLGGNTGTGRTFLVASTDPHHAEMLSKSIHDPFNKPFDTKSWHDGILSREISEGPKLALPFRDYVLFHGSLRTYADPHWQEHVPWRDLIGEEHGFPVSAQHPNLIWPADRAWVMASEIDFNFTLIAGSEELITALLADDDFESARIPENADLSWAGDEVNR